MSALHHIFVQPVDAGAELVADIGAACGGALHRVDHEFVGWAAKVGGRTGSKIWPPATTRGWAGFQRGRGGGVNFLPPVCHMTVGQRR
ncbi:hypothetical protein [Kitasatospora sp. NPDC088351]|uniref:hypothetical protein n=1 Tax=Kitasatospora sp. NPDC088351 TaxID=3155180 RepID=UPI003420A88C